VEELLCPVWLRLRWVGPWDVPLNTLCCHEQSQVAPNLILRRQVTSGRWSTSC